jgi:hypothetical protein
VLRVYRPEKSEVEEIVSENPVEGVMSRGAWKRLKMVREAMEAV